MATIRTSRHTPEPEMGSLKKNDTFKQENKK